MFGLWRTIYVVYLCVFGLFHGIDKGEIVDVCQFHGQLGSGRSLVSVL